MKVKKTKKNPRNRCHPALHSFIQPVKNKEEGENSAVRFEFCEKKRKFAEIKYIKRLWRWKYTLKLGLRTSRSVPGCR